MRYAIVIEKADSNYAAYVPDLPGCVTTAATIAEVEQGIREAIVLHIAGLREDGQPVPPPSSEVEYVDIAA
jgi:predicted RNase H-like HicB family nuclease